MVNRVSAFSKIRQGSQGTIGPTASKSSVESTNVRLAEIPETSKSTEAGVLLRDTVRCWRETFVQSHSGLLFLGNVNQYLRTLNTVRGYLVLLACVRTEFGHLHQPDICVPIAPKQWLFFVSCDKVMLAMPCAAHVR